MPFRIYTKTGDKGETSLFGGKRLPKSDDRIEAYGTVDELNSYIGLVRDAAPGEEVRSLLKEIQDCLFSVGAILATEPGKNLPVAGIGETDIERLEKAMDAMEERLPALKHFILPGGHPTVSFCHIARCVCRRAERRVVGLATMEEIDPAIIRYLNRLSDYLFVLARGLGQDLGVEEIIWTSR